MEMLQMKMMSRAKAKTKMKMKMKMCRPTPPKCKPCGPQNKKQTPVQTRGVPTINAKRYSDAGHGASQSIASHPLTR